VVLIFIHREPKENLAGTRELLVGMNVMECKGTMGKVEEMKLETLVVSRHGPVVHVELARPKALNAMNSAFWREFRQVFETLAFDGDCRAIVVSAQGRHFSVGLDIKENSMMSDSGLADKDSSKSDMARKIWKLRRKVLEMQDSFNAMEQCPQPVIVAAHGAVIGGAIDLLCAADIRLCSEDAWFSIKEVDIGLAADVGTLQRLHHVMGNSSIARELAYTARRMESDEAKSAGFLSSVHGDRGSAIKHALELAQTIATKSPVAVAGTKINLNFSREHTVRESLEFMATWNAGMLQTDDIPKAAMASISKSKQPDFSKL